MNDRPYHIVLHFLKSKAEVWRVQQVEYNHQNNKYEDASQNNSLNQPEHQKFKKNDFIWYLIFILKHSLKNIKISIRFKFNLSVEFQSVKFSFWLR